MKKIEVKMSRKQTEAFLTLVFVLAFLPTIAFAEPAWRGEQGTTFQQWSFSEPYNVPVEPDTGWVNDFGTPIRYSTANQWMSSLDQYSGICVLTGVIDITVPNYPVIQPEKEMWVELIWKAAGYGFLPDSPLLSVETDIGYDRMEIEREDDQYPNNWVNTLYKIHIWPNPPGEWISIRGDIYVDQVTVDTRCIPEPTTMALLVLGMALGLRRKPNV